MLILYLFPFLLLPFFFVLFFNCSFLFSFVPLYLYWFLLFSAPYLQLLYFHSLIVICSLPIFYAFVYFLMIFLIFLFVSFFLTIFPRFHDFLGILFTRPFYCQSLIQFFITPFFGEPIKKSFFLFRESKLFSVDRKWNSTWTIRFAWEILKKRPKWKAYCCKFV